MIGRMATARTGTIIKRARLRKRWTQQQLADAADVSLRTVGDWENRDAYPRNPVVVEEVLGISLDADDEGHRVISPQLGKMITETHDDPEDQRRVIGLLEGTLTWPGEDEGEGRRSSAG